ncbi:MAG: hypothetical protein HC884_16270 [Chloroflexaceae bacterium]|nr:hypothetical protein [Chloroflexaceae bacterium]
MIDDTGANPTEEEAAAALVAVALYLETEQKPGDGLPEPSHWCSSARLITQGFPIIRVPMHPRWGNIERLRRASRAGTGIIGL